MKLYKTSTSRADKKEALINGEVPVAVYGLGKMGLPLAAVYADVTGSVTGVDIDPDVVESVKKGESHIDREPGLDKLVEECVATGKLTATTDDEATASAAAVHVIIVPTLVTEAKDPDLSTIEAVLGSIASGIDPGDLVIIESTVPPRTSTDVVVPTLADKTDLSAGEFGVAFCPERTSSGRALQDIRGAYPKVVGGVDDESTKAAEVIYDEITENDVITVSDATTAEAVKVFEGVYRDVNIALANELAKYTDELEIDVLEAIETANTIPYCDIHTPGAGVGGHCIPYYPYFLIDQFDAPANLMRMARETNDSMPEFTVDKLLEGFNETGTRLADATVVVLGLTYRGGVKEIRHSPAIPIVDRLTGQGATVYVVDPVLDEYGDFGGAAPIELEQIYDLDVDGIVLVTAHEEFNTIQWDRFDTLVLVDGRNALDFEPGNHWVYTIGSGKNQNR